MPGPHTDDVAVLALYADPTRSIADIAREIGCHRRHVHKVVERNNAPRRGGRPKIWMQVAELARSGKEANEIAGEMNHSLASIETILTRLRRDGLIGMHDGRIRSRYTPHVTPSPTMRIPLDEETRMLLDGEAADLNSTPADVARRILQAVLADQELLDAALAAQEG